MKVRIFWSGLLLSLLLSISFAGGMSLAIRNALIADLQMHMDGSNARLCLDLNTREDQVARLQDTVSDYRITLISPQGDVSYDSVQDIHTMDNHSDREEFQEALRNGKGHSLRASSSIGTTVVYTARRLKNGSVLRLSQPEHVAIQSFQLILPWFVGGILMVILIAYLLSRRLTAWIIRPINAMDLNHPVETCPYDELLPMARQLSRQNSGMRMQVEQLQSKQSELNTLINAMSEGFVALDQKHNILSINRSACLLLNTNSALAVGKPLASIDRQPEIMQLLLTVDKTGGGETTFKRDGRTYTVSAGAVHESEKGVVLFMLDITDKVESENMRKRFTANVSHELRTPLTTICGYTEILASGMVKKEDFPSFFERINKESQRLLTLVEDILKLSKMDEGYPGGRFEPVDLLKIVNQVAESLESASEKKKVTLTVSGMDAQVIGDQTLLTELVFNLADNAIKYNRPGGKVQISIRSHGGHVFLQVADTGIGIEKNQQDKISERFYRTDKSRSKDTGGTGLGLSIVKHSAEYHHAKLHVDSTINEGTAITVTFPTKRSMKDHGHEEKAPE